MASIVSRASVPSSFEARVALVFSCELSYSSLLNRTSSSSGCDCDDGVDWKIC